MDYEQIRSERQGEVQLLTLNRPDKLNAWTPRMAEELADAIERANRDPGVGAIVMTGAGRGFCAGADMEATFGVRIEGGDPGANTAERTRRHAGGARLGGPVPAVEAARRGGQRRGGRHRDDDDPAVRRDRRVGEGAVRDVLHQGRARARAGVDALPRAAHRVRPGQRDVPVGQVVVRRRGARGRARRSRRRARSARSTRGRARSTSPRTRTRSCG